MSGLLGTAGSFLGRLQLRPASFRGIGFGVQVMGKEFGRRVVTHRYPKREKVQHEDMGLRERVIQVEGFIVGDDATARLLSLEAALQKEGVGRLMHPHYGELQVVCTAARSHAGLERGLFGFQASFEIDDVATKAPVKSTNGASLLDRLGLEGVGQFISDYGRLLTLDGLQDFVAEQLGDQLGGLGISIGDLASGYGLYQQVMGAVGLLGAFTGGGTGGLSAATSATAATAAVAALTPLGRRPDAALSLAASGGVPMPPPPIVPTPSRLAVAANAAGLDELARSSAAVMSARAAATVSWDSREEAIRYRDRVADALDDASDRAGAMGWDASWRALIDMRAAWVPYINATAARLPRIRLITLATPMSALQLAYQLDGDNLDTLFDRGADIARRNGIANPVFLPAGDPLEVLTDG
jgi:prophage DNA circulation protein